MKKLLLSAAVLVIATSAVDAGPDTALGCFSRTYDRAHLARHPDQLVTAVKLHIMRPPPGNGLKYWFALQFSVRGRSHVLHTGGYCREEKAPGLRCSVECDGGGVDVSPRGNHAMMYLDSRGIRMATCGKEYINEGEELSGGKDDRIFRLSRVDGAACKGVEP